MPDVLGAWLPMPLITAVVLLVLFAAPFALPSTDSARLPYLRRAAWVVIGITGTPAIALAVLYWFIGLPFIITAFLRGLLAGLVPEVRLLPLVLASPPFAENGARTSCGDCRDLAE